MSWAEAVALGGEGSGKLLTRGLWALLPKESRGSSCGDHVKMLWRGLCLRGALACFGTRGLWSTVAQAE